MSTMTEVSSNNLRTHGTRRNTVVTVHIHWMTPAVEIDVTDISLLHGVSHDENDHYQGVHNLKL